MTYFQKGQTVTFAVQQSACTASGYGHGVNFNPGDTAEVTAVRRLTVTVRVVNPKVTYNRPSKYYSYNVPREALATPNGEAWDAAAAAAKPKPRKIGVPPEGEDVILPTDPRLKWLWDDANKLASNSGYCSVFDRIADQLGIPGRLRDIIVNTKVNGVDISATVRARSTGEAEQILLDKLKVGK